MSDREAELEQIIELDLQMMKNAKELEHLLMAKLLRAEGYIQSQAEILAGWDAWIASHPL